MKTMQAIGTIVVGGLITLWLAGCSSVGMNFDESKVASIKRGETTEGELISLFGEPVRRDVSSEGTTTLKWLYSEGKVKGESFIPYAGPFLGGTRTKTKHLDVVLGADGKVVSYSCSSGGLESRGTTQDVPKK